MDRYEFMIAMTALIMGGVVVTTIITTISKFFMRRREGGDVGVRALEGLDQRLSRIEQGIDAMAVEVERISEGQRFTTRLLSDRPGERLKA